MIYKEANNIIDDISWVYNGKTITEEMRNECRDLCHKALEKQIPKKPTLGKWSKQLEDKYGDKYYECPCCGDDWNVNEYGSAMQYCWTCGQAINWNEVE